MRVSILDSNHDVEKVTHIQTPPLESKAALPLQSSPLTLKGVKKHSPLNQKGPLVQGSTIIALSHSNWPTFIGGFFSFVKGFEEIQELVLKTVDIDIDRSIQHIRELEKKNTLSQEKLRQFSKKRGFWETVSHLGGGVMDVVSLSIGCALLSSANPALIVAGVAMIISSIIALSCLILERTGTKNDLTLAFQIGGGIIGFIGGCAFFGAKLGTMKNVLAIFHTLVSVSSQGAKAIALKERKHSFEEEARSTLLSKELFSNKDHLETSFKIMNYLSEEISKNAALINEALALYQDTLKKIITDRYTRE